MSLLKQLPDKGGTTAWSPVEAHAEVLAIGTRLGAGVSFDDFGGELSFIDTSLSKPGVSDVVELGNIKTTSRFYCMAWGALPGPSGAGLIAGGMQNGVVHVWDPASILSGANRSPSPIATVERHKAKVNSLAFNPHSSASHLLATGSSDNEVYIMDMSKPTTPSVYSPGAQKHSANVTSIGWNPKVVHILASAAADGVCTVWDLRKKAPWCELRDPKGSGMSAIAWNPDGGLHIVTATDDDSRPSLKLWDLRNPNSFVSELKGHTKGISSLSWCPHDSGLLVSCGKDNKTYLWDMYNSCPVYEFGGAEIKSGDEEYTPAGIAGVGGGAAAGLFGGAGAGQLFGGAGGGGGESMGGGVGGGDMGNRRYEMHWSPIKKSIMSACSFDRNVSVFSLNGAGSGSDAGMVGDNEQPIRKHAPQWCTRRCGATFGFGGVLIKWSAAPPKAGQNPAQGAAVPKFNSEVTLCEYVSDRALVYKARVFQSEVLKAETKMKQLEQNAQQYEMAAQQAIAAGQEPPQAPHMPSPSSSFKEFCMAKGASTKNQEDKEMWNFMSILFESNARIEISKLLGYNADEIADMVPSVLADNEEDVASVAESFAPVPTGTEDGETIDQALYYGDEQHKQVGIGGSQGGNATDLFAATDENASMAFDDPPPQAPEAGGDITSVAGELPDLLGDLSVSGTTPAGDGPAGISGGGGPEAGGDEGSVYSNKPIRSLPSHLSTTTQYSGSSIGMRTRAGDNDNFSQIGAEDTGMAGTGVQVPEPGVEEMLRKALLVGDFKTAVNCCLANGMLSDALLLATCGGAEIWAKTQAYYLKKQCEVRPLMNVVSYIISGDLASYIQQAELNNGKWQEVLAILASYAKAEDFHTYCSTLAERLSHELGPAGQLPATLCYLCAIDVNNTLAQWVATANLDFAGETGKALATHSLVEKAVVFQHALPDPNAIFAEPSLLDMYITYATTLSAEGQLESAAHYLAPLNIGDANLAGPELSPLYQRALELCDRVFNAYRKGHVGSFQMQPAFPFAVNAPGVAQSIARHRTREEMEREKADAEAAVARAAMEAQAAQEAATKAEEVRRQQQNQVNTTQFGAAPAPAVSNGWNAAPQHNTTFNAQPQHQPQQQWSAQPAAQHSNQFQQQNAQPQQWGSIGNQGFGQQSHAPPPPSQSSWQQPAAPVAPPAPQAPTTWTPSAPAPAPQAAHIPAPAAPSQWSPSPAPAPPAAPPTYASPIPAVAAPGHFSSGPPAGSSGMNGGGGWNAAPPPPPPTSNGGFQHQSGGFQQQSGGTGFANGPMGAGPPPMGGASPQLSASAVPLSSQTSMHSGGGIPDDGFVTTVGNPELAKSYGNQNTASVNGTATPPPAAPVKPLEEMKQHTAVLDRLVAQIAPTLSTASQKRQIADVSKALGVLNDMLAAGSIAMDAQLELIELTTALGSGDWGKADQVYLHMCSTFWSTHKKWLKPIKVLIGFVETSSAM